MSKRQLPTFLASKSTASPAGESGALRVINVNLNRRAQEDVKVVFHQLVPHADVDFLSAFALRLPSSSPDSAVFSARAARDPHETRTTCICTRAARLKLRKIERSFWPHGRYLVKFGRRV